MTIPEKKALVKINKEVLKSLHELKAQHIRALKGLLKQIEECETELKNLEKEIQEEQDADRMGSPFDK